MQRVLLQTLLDVFGYRAFRSNQRGMINATLSGRDVFVIMPTGGGKSLQRLAAHAARTCKAPCGA